MLDREELTLRAIRREVSEIMKIHIPEPTLDVEEVQRRVEEMDALDRLADMWEEEHERGI